MYDMKPLEEEWKKYRKKKLRPLYIGIFISIILIVAVIAFMSSEKIDLNHIYTDAKTSMDALAPKEKKVEKKVESKIKKNVLIDPALVTLEAEESVAAASEVAEVTEVSEKPSDILVDIPILEEKDEPADEEVPRARKKIHIDIIETSSVTAYNDVEKRFSISHDPDDALFLANSYYKKGNYKKAEYWALQTNKIDEDIEESLLIFIKSKIKLGHNNEGMAILKSYIEKSNSEEAKKLLYQIENGKF